jgi:hypothetical protein
MEPSRRCTSGDQKIVVVSSLEIEREARYRNSGEDEVDEAVPDAEESLVICICTSGCLNGAAKKKL